MLNRLWHLQSEISLDESHVQILAQAESNQVRSQLTLQLQS